MVGKYSCGNSQSTNYRFEEIEEGEGDTVPMVTPKTSSNREFFSLRSEERRVGKECVP